MYGQASPFTRNITVARYGAEHGDAMEQGDAPSSSSAIVPVSQSAQQLSAAMLDPNPIAREVVAQAESNPQFQNAAAIARAKRMLEPSIQLLRLTNGEPLSGSFNDGAVLSSAERIGFMSAVTGSAFPFTPQPFTMIAEAADTLAFYPSAQLCNANGGPLPVGIEVPWPASYLTIGSSINTANPGVECLLRIEFGPPGTIPDQVINTRIYAGMLPSIYSLVHAVNPNIGRSMFYNRRITTTAAAPGPGLYPRLSLTGLPVAIYTTRQYRFVVPGDHSADRFMRIAA